MSTVHPNGLETDPSRTVRVVLVVDFEPLTDQPDADPEAVRSAALETLDSQISLDVNARDDVTGYIGLVRAATLSTNVRKGQIWAACNPHDLRRFLKVLEVDETHARVVGVDVDGELMENARRNRIRLDRFRPTSTGYRLVRDVED